jgi:hypothetical protein
MAAVKMLRWMAPLLLTPVAAVAAVITYTQNDSSCPGCVAIGVPVPSPQNSQTPVTGFRAYLPLRNGLQALALTSGGTLSFQSVGETLTGDQGAVDREIWAFRLGDADSLTAEGLPEPAFLQSGGIHAREWIAPEVVASYIERMVANRDDHGLNQYLIENVSSVLVPVLNVDGFLQTQAFGNQAGTEISGGTVSASTTPRDGRMRRKNMNAGNGTLVDNSLATEGDRLLGVDANRNNPPFCGQPGGSGDPTSLEYRGNCALLEAEVLALQAAAALAPANRLRLYIDTHSYTRFYLSAKTSIARRNTIQEQLALLMSQVAGNGQNKYPYLASSAGSGIGSTDEYFANTYQIPAYTLEVEPRAGTGLSDYPPGVNVSNSGFILPAAEVPRVRQELTDASVLGVYRQSGPPSVASVVLSQTNGGAVVFSGQWQVTGNAARSLEIATQQPLQPSVGYTLWLAFNKPMRVRDGNQTAVQYPGQNVALAPTLTLEGTDSNNGPFTVPITTTATGWLKDAGGAPNGYFRYADDAYSVNFTIPGSAPVSGAKRVALAVDVSDFSGFKLDANPATAADWGNGAWVRYEDANDTEGDLGGTDRKVLLVDNGGTTPPPAGGGGGGGVMGAGALAALGLLAALRRRVAGRSGTGSNRTGGSR